MVNINFVIPLKNAQTNMPNGAMMHTNIKIFFKLNFSLEKLLIENTAIIEDTTPLNTKFNQFILHYSFLSCFHSFLTF